MNPAAFRLALTVAAEIAVAVIPVVIEVIDRRRANRRPHDLPIGDIAIRQHRRRHLTERR